MFSIFKNRIFHCGHGQALSRGVLAGGGIPGSARGPWPGKAFGSARLLARQGPWPPWPSPLARALVWEALGGGGPWLRGGPWPGAWPACLDPLASLLVQESSHQGPGGPGGGPANPEPKTLNRPLEAKGYHLGLYFSYAKGGLGAGHPLAEY